MVTEHLRGGPTVAADMDPIFSCRYSLGKEGTVVMGAGACVQGQRGVLENRLNAAQEGSYNPVPRTQGFFDNLKPQKSS